jgi:hypothetical protein
MIFTQLELIKSLDAIVARMGTTEPFKRTEALFCIREGWQKDETTIEFHSGPQCYQFVDTFVYTKPTERYRIVNTIRKWATANDIHSVNIRTIVHKPRIRNKTYTSDLVKGILR